MYVGDYDPAGVLIDKKIEEELRRHLGGIDLTFHRLGITREQIDLMRLPTKPPKDRRGGFSGMTVEAEAMPAGEMRRIVRNAIESFIDQRELKIVEVAEESEREALRMFARQARDT